MRFLEHLIEGLRKPKLRAVKGLNSREVETLMNLVAKALVAYYAHEYKFSYDEMNPEDFIDKGIMQDVDSIIDINYGTLYRAVEEEVKKFQ